jgi:glycosyltransferase involved in cell wall biosynthesis
MKILFVTPYLPSPPYFGAQRRLDGLMRGLAANHEVSLLSFVAQDERTERSLEVTKSYCRELDVIRHDVLNLQGRSKRLLQLRSLISTGSFELMLMRRREFQARLDRLLAARDWDIVQCEFCHMGIYRFTPSSTRTRLVLDEHNIEYDLVKRTGETAESAVRRLYAQVNWKKLEKEERACWRRFDGVALTSARDEAMLHQSEPATPTAVVPNAVDLETFVPNDTPRDEASLLFLGAISYFPNTDGLLFFLDSIFPRIVALRPDVHLRVVGMSPPESVLARRAPNIEVTGFVEDPLPYLDRASVFVVPLRVGGGTRLKIVEAMGKGKAIVSTRIGAEGIDVIHEKHLLLADTPDEFAAQVVRLLGDPELGSRLGREARRLAEERYGWGAAVRRLEDFHDELLRKPARPAQA